MKRSGFQLKPTKEEERAKEIAAQQAIAAELTVLSRKSKQSNGKQP